MPEEYIPTAFLAPLAAATVCRDANIQNEYTNVIFKDVWLERRLRDNNTALART